MRDLCSTCVISAQIAQMTASSKKTQLALELYEIVPVLSEVMWDADDDVVSAATATLGKRCYLNLYAAS